MAKKKVGTTIDIYPATPRPPWLKRCGQLTCCHGEGLGVYFKVDTLSDVGSRAFLVTLDGYAHGWESYHKLCPPEYVEDGVVRAGVKKLRGRK